MGSADVTGNTYCSEGSASDDDWLARALSCAWRGGWKNVFWRHFLYKERGHWLQDNAGTRARSQFLIGDRGEGSRSGPQMIMFHRTRGRSARPHWLSRASTIRRKHIVGNGGGFHKGGHSSSAPPSAFVPSHCAGTRRHYLPPRRRVTFPQRRATLVLHGRSPPPRLPPYSFCVCAAQFTHRSSALRARRGGAGGASGVGGKGGEGEGGRGAGWGG